MRPESPFFPAHSFSFSKFGTMRQERNLRRSPMTTGWDTNWSPFRALSIGAGAMFFPFELTMISFFRSVIFRKPSPSMMPMSPVWNQPSGSIASAVASGLP